MNRENPALTSRRGYGFAEYFRLYNQPVFPGVPVNDMSDPVYASHPLNLIP